MSLFRTIEAVCPGCQKKTSFDLVHSVNADRAAYLRDAILSRAFQMHTCDACGTEFRIEPEFTYVHLGNHQWIAAWPSQGAAHWAEYEKQSQATFDEAYGATASVAAAELARGTTPRVTFGWEAIREKLVARAAGIDDVSLELVKIAILSTDQQMDIGQDIDMRLLEVDGETTLRIGRFDAQTERLIEMLSVPRQLLTDIETDAESWQGLRDQLKASSFVDVNKLTTESQPLV